MANIMFKKGTLNELQTNVINQQKIEQGTLYFTEDEGGLYLGSVNADKQSILKRIQGTVLYFNSLDEFTKNTKPPYFSDVIYYIADHNVLCRYDNNDGWVFITDTLEEKQALKTTLTNLGTKLESEIERATTAEGALGDLIQANTDLINSSVESVSTTLDGLDARITENTNNISTQTQTIQQLNTKIEAETTRAEGAEQSLLNSLSEITSALNDKIDRDELDAVNDAVTSAANAAKAAQDTADGVSKSVTDLGTEVNKKISDLEKEHTNFTTQIKDNKTAAENAQSAAEAAAGVADEAKSLATTANNWVTENQTLPAQVAGFNTALQTTESTLKAADEELVKNISAVDEKANAASDAVTSLSSEVGGISAQVTINKDWIEANKDIGSTVTTLSTKVDTASQAITTNATNIQTNAGNIQNLSDTKLSINGTIAMQGDLDLGGKNIRNITMLNEPISTDVATVGYVNDKVSDISTLNTALQSMFTADENTIYAQKNVSISGKTLTGISVGEDSDDSDAASVGYVKDMIAANDAMTFKGVVDQNNSLPTKANVGDTYKVGQSGKYDLVPDDPNTTEDETAYRIEAKVGDLIVNAATSDDEDPKWVHITSGYEDDYVQHLFLKNNIIYLNDGIHTEATVQGGNCSAALEFTVAENTNLKFDFDSTDANDRAKQISVTASMVWGSF